MLNSKDARNAWRAIAEAINNKFLRVPTVPQSKQIEQACHGGRTLPIWLREITSCCSGTLFICYHIP